MLQAVLDLARAVDLAVQRNVDRLFQVIDLEGGTVDLPAVGLLALEAVEDLLPEKSVLVVDAVAEAGHAEGGHGFQEASGQASEASIAQAGIVFAVEDGIEADTEAGQHLAAEFFQPQVRQVIAQRTAHQEFHGQVIQPLGIFVTVA